MTPTHYLHNGQLFEIDRMPPNRKPSDDASVWDRAESAAKWQDFLNYLSTLQPIPHAFTGENRVVPEDQIAWRYEVFDNEWKSVSDDEYLEYFHDYRRKVAVPKEAKELNIPQDLKVAELPHLSASTANWSKIKDKDEFLEEVRGEESLLDLAKSMYESAKKLLKQLKEYGNP